ncbi:MAG TPA: hypothetical protein PK253_08070 [Spirochaetota bacterium]|nr:hypothetical protein [Spirochaetota bacterium]
MNRHTALSCVLLLSVLSLFCYRTPERIPSGTWSYRLLLNGNEVGSAVMSNRREGNSYVSTSELQMKAGQVMNVSRQEVTESLDFRPQKLETHNKIIMAGAVQRIDTVAEFSGRTVKLTMGSDISTVTLDRDVVLDGNYFIDAMIKHGFKKNTKLEAYIYDPSIEIESPILLTSKVMGKKMITVNNETFPCIHIVDTIENIKSFDRYIDGNGVLVKAVLNMLNLTVELERK